MTSLLYHDGNRALQDEFGSRPLADRLEEKLTRTAFTADDKAQIETCIYFSSQRRTLTDGPTARSRAARRASSA